ncbi:MAG: ATP-binding protein [Planctomycetota bacterium]|jgi:PAS domain S-box-containing protein
MPFLQALPDSDLVRKIKWVLFFRLILVIFCVVLIVLLTAGERLTQAFVFSLIVLAVALVLNLFYLIIFRWIRDHTRFVLVQIIADAILESILIYLTGGANSVFTFLCLATIFAATMCVSSRAGYTFATGITIIVGVITLIYRLGVRNTIPLPLLTYDLIQSIRLGLMFPYVLVRLITHAIAFYMVAMLGGYLASHLTKYRILYEEILDNMTEGLIAIDDTGRIIYINDEARRLLNHLGRGSLIFRNIKDVFRRREEMRIVEILVNQEDIDCELRLEMRTGDVKDMNVKTNVLRDSRGKSRGIIGIFTDLTPRKRMEEIERRAARLKEIEELATSIAHEIRNPLASIRGAIQELARPESAGTEPAVRLADIAMKESDRLDNIIGNFLRFARMRQPEFAEIDAANLLEEVAILLRQRSDAKNVEIVTELPVDIKVKVDSEQIKQAFLNIGVNSLEAINGSGSLRITGSLRHSTGRIRKRDDETVSERRRMFEITFEDSGEGISAEDLTKVFTPFFTGKTDGTGLGLPIVHKIINLHGGTIDIRSEPGKGTRVRVALPLAQPAMEEKP